MNIILSKNALNPFRFLILVPLLAIFFFSCNHQSGKDDFSITNFSTHGLDSLHKELNAQVRDHPEDAAPLFHRAQLFIALKDTIHALGDLDSALRRDTNRIDIYLYYAKTNEDHAIITKAVNAYKKVLQKDPQNTVAMIGLGRIFYHIKNRDESFNYLNMAIGVDQNLAEAYYYRGLNFKETNFTDNALKSLQTAVASNPKYYDAYLQLGLINAELKKPIAAAYYENAIRINPDDVRAFFSRGYYYQSIDSTRLAIKDYVEAVRRDPNDKHLQYNLAYNYYVRKDYESAYFHFTNAYNLDSTFHDAKAGMDSCKPFVKYVKFKVE